MGLPSLVIVIFLTVTGFGVVVGWNVKVNDGTNFHVNDFSHLYDDIRLPGNIVPLTYSIFIHPNITDGKFLYTGTVKILMKANEQTDLIVLHSLRVTHLYTHVYEVPPSSVNITEPEVDHEKQIKVKKTVMHVKNQQALIQLGSKLSTGKKYVLHIAFSAQLRKELRGFYRTSYKTNKGEVRFLATTFFTPGGARLAFPCFDEPAMKATFSIAIVRESIHTTLSNMPVKKEVLRNDGLIVDYFQESVKMSTYLVAFVVSDFISVSSTTKRGIQVKVWAPKDQITLAKYAVEIAPHFLDYYERFFKINYQLPKMDLIGIPDFTAGAMENWGLVTFRLKYVLYDEKMSSSAAKQNVAMVIAHELAHQWFGNLVTFKWWRDTWLNEGFATFMSYLAVQEVYPNLEMMAQFTTDIIRLPLMLDSRVPSHPVSVEVKNPADIGALFDAITYKKGASIISMMRDFLGHENFAEGLTYYLNKYKFANADSDDLWDSLSKKKGLGRVDLKYIMDTWVLKVGYPVVNIRRVGDVAYLTQERFLTDTASKKNISMSKWNIPLTYNFEHSNTQRNVWFIRVLENVRLYYNHSLGWIKMNLDQRGFYRVNYDENNWKALSTQLQKNHQVLSALDRTNLIDDAFQLAISGKIHQTTALELTEYLTEETEYAPITSALTSLDYIGDILRSSDGYPAYEKYLLKLISPIVRKLGWVDTGSHLEKRLREIVLKVAVRLNDTDSVKKAKAMFDDWMVNKKNIAANLREAVYYTGVKYGAQREWNYLFELYKKCQQPAEKQLLMFSLTHTTDPKLLKRYLEQMLDSNIIKSQDTCYVINKISLNPVGEKMAYDYVMQHWAIFIKRYGTDIGFRDLAELFTGIFGTGTTKTDLSRAEHFFSSRKLGGGKLAAKQALESIRSRIHWLERNEKTVAAWFRSKV